MSVERAFIMAAGAGTRLWPAGIDVPKSSLVLGNELLIHRVLLNECVAAGITDVTVVLPDDEHEEKSLARAIKGTFDSPPQDKINVLKSKAQSGDAAAFQTLNRIADFGRIAQRTRFVTQPAYEPATGEKAPYGTAVPVQLCMNALAREGMHLRDDEQVAVLNADDALYRPDGGCDLYDAIRAMDAESTELGIIGTPVTAEEVAKGGLVLPDGRILEHAAPHQIPEHPTMNTGRYVLPRYVLNDLVNEVMREKPAANGEYQLTTAVNKYAQQGHPITVHRANGAFLNCGDPVNYARSNAIVNGILPA
jgi:UTP-glucose-1-phosphate uridylyltransferase